MEKSESLPKWKIIYLLLIAVLIVVVIVGDIVIFGKLDGIDIADGIKATITVISILIIVLAIGIAVFMFKAIQDEEKVFGVRNDKYKRLFLNLPIGFAQAQILRDIQSGRNMGYRISDANENFRQLFNLDISDYLDKNISESKVEVLQDINAWFEAYNNSGTKQGELLTVEITLEKLNKVFNTVMYKSEADYINMVVIDITEQKETENKLSLCH